MWWDQRIVEDICVWSTCGIPGFIFTNSVHWWLQKYPHKPRSGSEEALRCAHLCFSRLPGYLPLSISQVPFENLYLSNVDGNRVNTLLLSWAVRIALNLCIWYINQVFLLGINSVLMSPLLEATCFKYIFSTSILWTTLFRTNIPWEKKQKVKVWYFIPLSYCCYFKRTKVIHTSFKK